MLLATLSPQPGSATGPDFLAPMLPDRGGALRDGVQNLLLYVPFGTLLAVRRSTAFRTMVAAATISLGTEVLQFFVPGRDPVALDVLTNVIGAALGWMIARTGGAATVTRVLTAIEAWLVIGLHPARAVAAMLSLCWAGVIAAVIATTCWLFSPALPPPDFYGVVSPSIDRASGPVRVGGTEGGFRGLIDEVRIYSRARSAGEIRLDMSRAVSTARPSDPGLVAAYGFDTIEGDTTADAVVPERRAAVRGAKWTLDGRFGGALAFDGTATEVVLPESPALDRSSAITLEAWVSPSGPPDGEAPVISLFRDAYYLQASSDAGGLVPSAGGRFGTVPVSVRTRRRIPTSRWTHLATTFDGRVIELYVNGRLSAVRTHWSSHHPVSATLDGFDLPIGPVADPPRFRSLLSGAFTLRASIRCGSAAATSGPVFLVSGLHSVDALALDAVGSELRVRFPRQARRLGLVSADYRVPEALSLCVPGQTLSFALRGPLQRPRLEDASGRTLAAALPGLGSGWTVLTDSQVMPASTVAAVSICGLGVLLIPFGFWARTATPTVVGVLILLASFYVVPRAWGMMAPLDAPGLAAAMAGFILGAALSRMGAQRSTNLDERARS